MNLGDSMCFLVHVAVLVCDRDAVFVTGINWYGTTLQIVIVQRFGMVLVINIVSVLREGDSRLVLRGVLILEIRG